MKKLEKKLFLVGITGILMSCIYYILSIYIIFSYWDGYIYGDTPYCYLTGRYSQDIIDIGIALFYLFIGFTVGIGSIIIGNRRMIE